jgi:hypothetical protein
MFTAGLVNLYTRDIEAGLHLYRDLLGFTETFRTPAEGVPSHVELLLNGFKVGLGTVEAARRVHGVEAVPGSPAMVLWWYGPTTLTPPAPIWWPPGFPCCSHRTTPATTTGMRCCETRTETWSKSWPGSSSHDGA